MSTQARLDLIDHLRRNAVLTDGPFTLRSGATSSWYVDARQTTFDGAGGRLVGAAVAEVLPEGVTAVGGLTMGADPVALATAFTVGAPLRAFSIRKEEKTHGPGGRLVGPVHPGDRVVVVEDTTTTGSAIAEAVGVLATAGVDVAAALAVVDRSDGAVAERMEGLGVSYTTLVSVPDLGVG